MGILKELAASFSRSKKKTANYSETSVTFYHFDAV